MSGRTGNSVGLVYRTTAIVLAGRSVSSIAAAAVPVEVNAVTAVSGCTGSFSAGEHGVIFSK